MMRLADKIAIVTGGGSGFGEGIVRKFVQEGARVVVADRDEAAARRVADSLHGKAIAVLADVTSERDFKHAVSVALNTLGGLQILVNNAGMGQRPQPLEELDEDLFDSILAVNVKSIYFGARAVVAHFRDQGGGCILNVASTGAVRPRPNLTWYNASKGWVTTATRAMAIELAPSAIRVNAINPVAGATPMLATFMREDNEANRQAMIDSIPMGRLSTPADVANAAAFLCSDEASMITGVAMEVDGGRCI